MTWYKKSQQQDFEFLKDIPKSKPKPIEETKEYQDLKERTPALIGELIENVTNLNELIGVFKIYRLPYKKIDFPKDSIVTVEINNQLYVIDDFKYPTLKEANDWVWGIWSLENYIPSPNFSETFWNDVRDGYKLYHATHEENIEEIKKTGLIQKNESRGISNRGTGNAVFTSDNPDDIGSYGDIIFEIDIGSMKRDGYMPGVSREDATEEAEQMETLAHKIGLENFNATDSLYSEGIYSSTIIIYGQVPAKYLQLYSGVNNELV